MATISNTAVLKGAGVEPRVLVVGGQPDERSAALWALAGGAGRQAPRTPREMLEEASRLLDAARQEAARLVDEANRLRGQAQVELGRSQAEAEQLRTQAQSQLSEVGETIQTAAEARALLVQSQQQAAELVANAQLEAAQTLTQAREEGHAEGLRTGQEEGERQAREAIRADLELAHEIAAHARIDRQQLIAEAEPEIIRLAIEVARKIVAREIESDPDILKGIVTRAMLKVAGNDRIRLRLNPAAIDQLGEYLIGLTQRFADRGVDVVADRMLEVSGAVIETRSGAVDASVETQLGKIGRTMLALAGE